MLINKLNLSFECDHLESSCCIFIRNRQDVINNIIFTDKTEQTIAFDMSFPNRLFFDLSIKDGNSIRLTKLILSGLPINENILDQICIFQSQDSDTTIVTRQWTQSGNAFIDFFAQDWIQYHLLYGNKINKQ